MTSQILRSAVRILMPLLLLFEGSVIFARIFGRPPQPAAEAELNVTEPPPSGPA